MKTAYLCPVCHAGMEETDTGIVCENRHLFDKSAEGYVNFAAVKKGVTALSGDAADTCRARREFLERGFYEPLAKALAEALCRNAPLHTHPLVIDAGCGEGYYDRFLKHALPQIDLYGLDLAKTAVRLAAKKQKQSPERNHYCVDGIFAMPFADASAGAVLSVFAPVPDAECRRVLVCGGILLVASPGKDHLYDLKKALYQTPEQNEEKTPAYEGFVLLDEKSLSYDMALSGADAGNLFAMTPYFWRSSADVRARSEKLGALSCRADFRLKIYKKCAD